MKPQNTKNLKDSASYKNAKKTKVSGADELSEEASHGHWADRVAEALIAKHPGRKRFVCASGISPSGVVHIGNFREVITVDFVTRALRERGCEVRFIYSWDDYDAFRKVPANLPRQEELKKELRKPLAQARDPFGDCESFAAHFEKEFEKDLKQVGIEPEFIYQNKPYRQGKYREGIRQALLHEKEIIKILNSARTEPLPDDWTCVSIFCKQCLKDATKVCSFDGSRHFVYSCKICQKEFPFDLSQDEGIKLLWRVDWPMRWAAEEVDFEPGGKDHSSHGGSRETGEQIIRAVWQKEAPDYLQYDFVLIKGVGAKLSSSSGTLITLGEALEIYEPEVVRYIFAGRKPNSDFAIAFDLDVIKAYDDFDRVERSAYSIGDGDEKKTSYERRIYEFSVVTPIDLSGKELAPAQFPFRHLCNILQVHQGEFEKAKAYFSNSIKSPDDEQRFYSRAKRAWKWVTTFAPEEFKFSIRPPTNPPEKTQFPEAVTELVQLIKQPTFAGMSEESVAHELWQMMQRHKIEPKVFFQEVYFILIAKKSGPKLASFLISLGPERAGQLLEEAL